MRIVFCPEVRALPPSPYCWFSANPAISTLLLLKKLLAAPQVPHLQSSGNWLNGSPGGIGYDGSPIAWLYKYPHELHSDIPVFRTANFSSSLRLSNISVFVGNDSGSDSGFSCDSVMGCCSEVGLSSLETSMDFEVKWSFGYWDLRRVGGNVTWGFGLRQGLG